MVDTGVGGDFAFWTWGLRAYAGEGVAEACLALQDDDGQCVPLLLWAAWAGDAALPLASPAADLARAWQAVILPLRTLRRRLKSEISASDAPERLILRAQVKAAELQAEKCLMAALASLGEKSTLNQPLERVLSTVAAAWGANPSDMALARLAQALIKGGFLEYSPA